MKVIDQLRINNSETMSGKMVIIHWWWGRELKCLIDYYEGSENDALIRMGRDIIHLAFLVLKKFSLKLVDLEVSNDKYSARIIAHIIVKPYTNHLKKKPWNWILGMEFVFFLWRKDFLPPLKVMLQSTQDKLREAVTQSKMAFLQNLLNSTGSLNFFRFEIDLNISTLDTILA